MPSIVKLHAFLIVYSVEVDERHANQVPPFGIMRNLRIQYDFDNSLGWKMFDDNHESM